MLINVRKEGEKIRAGRTKEKRERDSDNETKNGDESSEACKFPGVETGPVLDGVARRGGDLGGHWRECRNG